LDDSFHLIVIEEEEGLRLDVLLKNRFSEQSRTYFQYLINQGLVHVNERSCKKRELVKAGDEIEVEFRLTEELNLEPQNIPLSIIYEDGDILVIDKPAGLVVHPAPGNWSNTFVNALLYHCNELKNQENTLRPGIVHRLDKDTTGLLVAAKTEKAHQKLVEAFAARKVHKEYLAICLNHPKEGIIETKIARHPFKRKQMCVSKSDGKNAITEVFPLHRESSFSLVQFILHTGRTHQIRVHMQMVGCPILGDETYGFKNFNERENVKRQLLHAHRLTFFHPITGIALHFEAPIPKDFLPYMKNFSQEIPTRKCVF
jgi:23S rRNA pseudouridine1911/1915/1917 synthase